MKQTFESTLGNGLKLIGEVNPDNKSTSMGFFVRTGSRDEVGDESGVSHFLEHMMFKGTKTRSALDITYELGNLGAQANAFTSEENTVYYASVVPQYFEQMLTLLADMLRPALDPDEFTVEKKVILEEIALYQDRPQFYLFENAMRDYFAGHTAGNSVLGSTASISALTQEQMKNYFDRRYVPSNIVLVASGAFDWKRFEKLAGDVCGTWSSSPADRKALPFKTTGKKQIFYKKDIEQAHVLIIGDGPKAQDDERYAMSILSLILGDGSGSKIFWELVDKGLVESAVAESDEKDGAGCFLAYASTSPDKLNLVKSILHKILNDMTDFSDQELEQAKTKLLSRMVLNGELPMGRLMALGNDWIYRKNIHNLRTSMERIKAISRRDILTAVEKYPLKIRSEFLLLPEK